MLEGSITEVFEFNREYDGIGKIPTTDSDKILLLIRLFSDYVLDSKNYTKANGFPYLSEDEINKILEDSIGSKISDIQACNIQTENNKYMINFGNRGEEVVNCIVNKITQTSDTNATINGFIEYTMPEETESDCKFDFIIKATINKNSMFGGYTINSLAYTLLA